VEVGEAGSGEGRNELKKKFAKRYDQEARYQEWEMSRNGDNAFPNFNNVQKIFSPY
jgi:hypothetical protein